MMSNETLIGNETFQEVYNRNKWLFFDISYSGALAAFNEAVAGILEIIPENSILATKVSEIDGCLSIYTEFDGIKILIDLFFDDGIVASGDITINDNFQAFEGSINQVLKKFKDLLDNG